MFYDVKPSLARPVVVRVFTSAGEIIEAAHRSTSAALGYIRHAVSCGYWFGKVMRVEYEYYKGYRGE